MCQLQNSIFKTLRRLLSETSHYLDKGGALEFDSNKKCGGKYNKKHIHMHMVRSKNEERVFTTIQ